MAGTTTDALKATGPATAPVQKSRNELVGDMLGKYEDQIAKALPKNLTAERFARVCLTAVRSTPKLLICEPRSLLAAVMLSAQTGLEPGPLQHAYFIPKELKQPDGSKQWQVVWMLGYKGILELAQRSGMLARLEAHVVYENDDYDAEYGSDAFLRHRPAHGDRGAPIGAYSLWRTRGDGDVQWRFMGIEQIHRVRDESASAGTAFSPWKSDLGYLAMVRKTPIRASLPYLPTSIELAGAAAADERVHTDLSDDMLADVIDVAEVPEGGE